MNITLEIDELVLHGFPAEARYTLAEALEQELRELLSQRATRPPGPRTPGRSVPDGASAMGVDGLPTVTVALPPGATPQQAGRLAGRALYAALEQVR